MNTWKKCTVGILSACLLLSLTACFEQEQPKKTEYAESMTVSVSGGKVRGVKGEDNSVAIYKGIPYAAAPVGELRWKAPAPVENWSGELDCSLWGANAMQGDATTFDYWTEEYVQDTDPAHYRDGVVYSEDCLTLNVWSSYAVTKNKPVLVFIHGGGYNSGGASCEVYDGEAMAKKGVVFVSIQYRVGALGYLTTPALIEEGGDLGAGNYGLLDQIAALKWVQNNVAKFGGNPQNVTVMGQSAGAGSVNALLSSPLSEGLFQQAVSASFLNVHENWKTATERANTVTLSYNGKPLKNMTAEELRAIPASALKGMSLNYSTGDGGPCIDGYALTQTFASAMAQGVNKDVALMTGSVGKDDAIFSYFTNSSITAKDTMLALHSAVGKLRAQANSASTYIYMFDHNVPGVSGLASSFGPKHSYDVGYFFGNLSAASGRVYTETDQSVSELMMQCLVDFCTVASPHSDWLEYSADNYYMLFTETYQCLAMDGAKNTAVYNHYGIFN